MTKGKLPFGVDKWPDGRTNSFLYFQRARSSHEESTQRQHLGSILAAIPPKLLSVPKSSPVELVPDHVKDTIWDKCRQAAATFDGNGAFDKTCFSSIDAPPVQLARCIDAWVSNDNETDPLADLYLTS